MDTVKQQEAHDPLMRMIEHMSKNQELRNLLEEISDTRLSKKCRQLHPLPPAKDTQEAPLSLLEDACLALRYLRFDLEATRRENRHLRDKLEQSSDDEQ